jgi:hypothetical protein
MPENFSTILDALADEGRGRMRPFPAASILALARARQRRQRLAAATSGVVACAVAAGVALGTGGSHSVAPKPTTPIPRPTTAGTRMLPPEPGFGARYLQDPELPNAAAFQWKHDVTQNVENTFDTAVCGSAGKIVPQAPAHSQSAELTQYRSPLGSEGTFETIYHYASEADAEQDYARLLPDPDRCTSQPLGVARGAVGRQTGSLSNGFAWVQTQNASSSPSADAAFSQYIMAVQSGNELATLTFQTDGIAAAPYDTAGDQAVLQRMADRLAGKPVAPVTATTPPGTLIDATWMTAAEIPFAKADKSAAGWLDVGAVPGGPGADPAPDVCASARGGVVDGKGSTLVGHLFHGTPPGPPPLDPSTGYLYSSASEYIGTFTDPSGAVTAFDHAKQLTTIHSCKFKDGDVRGTRTVKAGPVTATGFSVAMDDSVGMVPHTHLYVVIKGTHVAELSIGFQSGADNTDFSRDAAVLTTMAARLP